MPAFARKYHVIAMDTLGYGDSDKPAKVSTLDVYAETVTMLMDALGLKKSSLVGHHTGAKIAEFVAVRYPDRVGKLVLSSPGLLESEEMKRLLKKPLRSCGE